MRGINDNMSSAVIIFQFKLSPCVSTALYINQSKCESVEAGHFLVARKQKGPSKGPEPQYPLQGHTPK